MVFIGLAELIIVLAVLFCVYWTCYCCIGMCGAYVDSRQHAANRPDGHVLPVRESTTTGTTPQ